MPSLMIVLEIDLDLASVDRLREGVSDGQFCAGALEAVAKSMRDWTEPLSAPVTAGVQDDDGNDVLVVSRYIEDDEDLAPSKGNGSVH